MCADAREYERLRWRCRRGMLELDLLLQGFLVTGYHQLGGEERERFDRLLALPDPQLLECLLHGASEEEKELSHVIERIRAAAAT